MRLRGLYAITDDRIPPRDRFIEFIEAAIKGGIDLLQLRLKKVKREELYNLAEKVLKITREHNIPLFINDYPDVAMDVGADGVHVGKEDTPVRKIRSHYPRSLLVGASAYGDVELALKLESEGADYVAFGNFFRSPVKPDEEIVPLSILGKAKSILKVPVFAIGGINHKNAPLILEEGADGIAMVSAVFGYEDPETVEKKTKELKEIVGRFLK